MKMDLMYQGALESLEDSTSEAKVWSAEETKKILEKKLFWRVLVALSRIPRK